MALRARRKSFVGEDDEEIGRGPWTELEKRRFLEGLAKYGKDFRRITAEIGTREIAQVRRYYTYHKSKMDPANLQTTPTTTTPSSSRKRKNAHDEGIITATTLNRKKNKKMTPGGSDAVANMPLAKMPPGPPEMKTMASPPFVSSHMVRPMTAAAARKRSPSKSAEKLNQGQDILPPPQVIYQRPKPKSRSHVKPAKVGPKVVNSSSTTAFTEERIPTSMATSLKKERLLELLRREEVQSVLSGLVGFLAVIAFKKFVG